MQNADSLVQRARHEFLHQDIDLLNDFGCSDKAMGLIAAEHAARTETMLKAIQCPTTARAMTLQFGREFLRIASELDTTTVQEPELAHVG